MTLSVVEAGSGAPIVLLHGLGDDHALWRHQVGPLAKRRRVVTPDLRGHGRSPIGMTPFSLEEMADDVRVMIERLDLDRPVVAGLSMGGGIAQALAIRHPKLVRALVLVSTSSEFRDETRLRFLDRAARAEREGIEAVIDATVPRWFTAEFVTRAPEEVAHTTRTVAAMDPAAFAAASRANAVRNLTARLGEIACPVLFIGGALDPADPHRSLEIYRRELRHLTATIVPDASHLVPVEQPAAFNAILLRFLDEVESIDRIGGES
jgi:3-oxoadipate enol-lactonase